MPGSTIMVSPGWAISIFACMDSPGKTRCTAAWATLAVTKRAVPSSAPDQRIFLFIRRYSPGPCSDPSSFRQANHALGGYLTPLVGYRRVSRNCQTTCCSHYSGPVVKRITPALGAQLTSYRGLLIIKNHYDTQLIGK